MWKTCLSRGYVSFHLSLPSFFASLAVAVTYESIFPRLVTFSPGLGWNVGGWVLLVLNSNGTIYK